MYKRKERRGVVDRVLEKGDNAQNVIVRNLFNANFDVQQLVGLKINTEEGDEGRVESSFGKTGKLKAYFEKGFAKGVKKGDKLILPLRKYVFSHSDEKKKMVQE